MADNITLNSGSGGSVVRTDDDGAAHWQYVKLAWGADNTQTIVDTSNPIPVDIRAENASVTVDNGGTFAVQAAQSGNWTLAANSGVDIGDVDVTSLIPGTAATNLGKAIDTAAGSTDTGVATLAVRDDALSTLTPAANDYTPLLVDSEGALWTREKDAVVDSNNSTTTPLTGGADYTGTYTDVSAYSGITVSIYADGSNSDANGMKFIFSNDGTNDDFDIAGGFDYVDGTGRTFQFPIQAQFFRVQFNQSGTQTAFRLETLLHKKALAITSVHRADADIAVDRSATLTKSILMAQLAGSGAFTPIDATTGGNLKVSVEEGTITPTDNYATPTAAIDTVSINMVYDGSTWDFARGDATDGLLVNLGTNNDITGTVTANAGTNLNTSALLTTTAFNDAFGTAGSADSQVLSVQGVASMTPVVVDLGANNDIVQTVAVGATGTTTYYNNDLDETEVEVDTGPVNIYSIQAFNTTAAPLFLQMWNTNTVTVGTTKPTNQYVIPGNADSDGAGFSITFAVPKTYGTALSIACTTNNEGNGAPGANACIINIEYAT